MTVVLMMTTADLLDYLLLVRNVGLRCRARSGCTIVDVSTDAVPAPGADIEEMISRLGLTITVVSRTRPDLTVNGEPPRAKVDYERVDDSTWNLIFPIRRRTLPGALRC